MATGHSDSPLNYWLILAFGAYMIVLVVISTHREGKMKAALTALAKRLGWEPTVVEQGQETIIRGVTQGCAMQIRQYELHSRNANVVFGEIAATARTAGFDFTLTRVGWGDRVLEKLGDTYDKTNDAMFDRAWHMATYYPEGLRALLSPDLRAKLMDLASRDYTGELKLDAGKLTYMERRYLTDPAFLSRIENIVGFMVEVAAAAETVVEKMPPPPKRDGYGDPVSYSDDKSDDDWGEASPDYDRSP